MMDWRQLLSENRLGKPISHTEHDRTAFQKDVDRIIFSSAFRRLQDKTQVFPLTQNDYVRTRLTHSLEVSCAGRSLGTLVGKNITTGYNLTHVSAEDFGSVVAAACLAHDIGNPPFGHFGEEAIRAFFVERPAGQSICQTVSEEQKLDLSHFEGNAQGFRILTQLQHPDTQGGMQLTYATLGAFSKYPCTRKYYDYSRIANKKNGILTDDILLFEDIAKQLGLIRYESSAWARHPLVYLMEAADDICYAIIDIEDAHQINQLNFDAAYDLLRPLAKNANNNTIKDIQSDSDKLSYLRAKAIGSLIQEAADVFMDNEKTILNGKFYCAITDEIPSSEHLKQLTEYAEKHIYNCDSIIKTKIAGYRILGDLMEIFCTGVEDIAKHQNNTKYHSKSVNKMLINLLPNRFIGLNRQFSTCPYKRSLKVIDYISGMTDSYAVNLHQKLTGVSIQSPR